MNNTEFTEKVSQNHPAVIVDFWAPWCGPCRMTKPILDKLAQEYAGKVEFLPVNADESAEVLKQYHVYGIPTVLAFRGGELAGRVTGAQNEAGYRAMFAALADGSEVKIPISPFDRVIRLVAGAALILAAVFTGYWVLAVLGAFLAFLGIYDRCPIWAAVRRWFKSRRTQRPV